MIKVIHDADMYLPVKMWIDEVEASALGQILRLAKLPFAFHHIAIMPDCHTGYGMPIGGVLATEGVVIPNAVGVDIGCGMCAVKTSLQVEQLTKETLKKIMGKIREAIPVGFNHHKEKQDEGLMPGDWGGMKIVEREYKSALTQLGTLGGGNHFIEIQKDTENNIWIMVHSGSRNLGYKVADYYNEIAYDMDMQWRSNTYLPKNKKDSLSFLPIEDPRAKTYMAEMQYCVDFALANRKLMMERIFYIFGDCFPFAVFGYDKNGVRAPFAYPDMNMINIAHNYARYENHFGKNVIVHRKGATSARKDEIGIIPGSQGSKSYIVRGLGNIESFTSCSHGAGRIMGRKQAIKDLDLQTEIKRMDDLGVIHGLRTRNDLQEAAGAYKNIDEVMQNQADLVEIITELQPLAVIKGD